MEIMDTPKELNEIVLPQTVIGPLTRAAIFLVLAIRVEQDRYASLRSFFSDLAGLVRAVEFRNVEAGLTCVVGFGSEAWDKLFGSPRPAELHPFKEIRSGGRHAVSTPGDILFHIRAKRPDLCFELAAQIMEGLGDLASIADEVHGFRYFDDRDVIGFVDGTENPRGGAAQEAAIVGEEDRAFAGGSYVIVQKYLHDMKAWNALPIETQERIIGRKKLSDIELKDAEKPPFAHNALTTIEENGKEVKILRDNMPFGRPGHGEFGTYFIGYSRTPRITELMLHVRRAAPRQLRPAARFQQTGYRGFILCTVLIVSRQHQRRRTRLSAIARSLGREYFYFEAAICASPAALSRNWVPLSRCTFRVVEAITEPCVALEADEARLSPCMLKTPWLFEAS
jgi:putative iron-dependent peroxidase